MAAAERLGALGAGAEHEQRERDGAGQKQDATARAAEGWELRCECEHVEDLLGSIVVLG